MLERTVRKSIASSLLSLLLLTTLVWGGCISCEQYFMFSGEKSCCTPDGHCKRKAPASHSSRQSENPDENKDCRQIAYDHHKAVDLHIELPMVAVARLDLPVPMFTIPDDRHRSNLIEPSPPDLQVLHSVFII